MILPNHIIKKIAAGGEDIVCDGKGNAYKQGSITLNSLGPKLSSGTNVYRHCDLHQCIQAGVIKPDFSYSEQWAAGENCDVRRFPEDKSGTAPEDRLRAESRVARGRDPDGMRIRAEIKARARAESRAHGSSGSSTSVASVGRLQ